MHYLRAMVQTSFTPSEIEKLPASYLDDERAVEIIRIVVIRSWITTPKEKRTLAEIARQVNRLVETALRQLEEDIATINADGNKTGEKGG